jgi:hypothetical protein
MRFNEVTRQSVGKVWLAQHPDGTASLRMQPDCLAMEYLKTMASAGKAHGTSQQQRTALSDACTETSAMWKALISGAWT